MVNFSVIIPTYNRPHLIGRAIKSALLNIIPGDEIIIINDGSQKDYSDVKKAYDHDQIRFLEITNAGVSAARNCGLDEAKNDFIAFLDDDDEWYDSHLRLQRQVYEAKPDLAGVFTNFDYTLKSGERLTNGVARWSKGKAQIQDLLGPLDIEGMSPDVKVYTGYQYINQLKTDYILPSSFSFNRRVCGAKDRFLVGLNRNQTWLFNSHVCSYGDVAYIDAVTCAQHGDAEIRNTGIGSFRTILSRLTVMQNEWGNNNAFLEKHRKIYEKVKLSDFFFAFKIALKELSIKKLIELVRLVGLRDAIKYIPLSMFYLFKPGAIEKRTT